MNKMTPMSIIDGEQDEMDSVAQGTPSSLDEMIACVANTDVTIVLQGESGVGKGVTAETIHQQSSRRTGRLVKVNCAALPEPLLESELFGYERGAFTGADRRKLGQFEVAHSGTLFLDEIAELSRGLQAKLLHVLQNGAFVRLGGTVEISPDVRVIVAANQDLEELVARKVFREDLFYRLNVMTLWVPPLRERRQEIVPLAKEFLNRFSTEYARPAVLLTANVRSALRAYPWPGNIRELENAMRRMVLLGYPDQVMKELHAHQRKRESFQSASIMADGIEDNVNGLGLKDIAKRAAREAERTAIESVLAETGWNRLRAAKKLKVSYKALLYKMQDCGLDAKSQKTK